LLLLTSFSQYFNTKSMRSIFTLLVLVFTISILQAQVRIEEYPLSSNVVLQKAEALRLKAQEEKLVRYFGEESGEARTGGGDCEDDGIYEDGETVYVLSGESIDICLDTTGFETFEPTAFVFDHGSISTFENCLTYSANNGIDLGLGDTVRLEFCLPDSLVEIV